MKLLKNTFKVSGLTMVSRLFGLVRDQFFAGLVGAGFLADCYVYAFRIPNLLRELLAEGALSNAFVPTFTKTIDQDSPKQAMAMASKLLGLLIVVVGSLVCLGIIFAPEVVGLIAPGFKGIDGKIALTADLVRIMFPFLLFLSLASVFMGIHHAHQSFSVPAVAPVFFNLSLIATGIILWTLKVQGPALVVAWSVGTLVGGFLQCAIQVPKLIVMKRLPLPSFRGVLRNKRVREMMLLMLPAIIALSGTQINILVNTILASKLEQGAAAWLSYGFRLMQLPIGLFGVAIGVVALAQASKDASSDNMEGFHHNVQQAMRLNWLLTFPCAAGLLVMAGPIIALLFERGAFTSFDTLQTAQAIQSYALGLPFYAAVKVKGPIFFTKGHSKVPMVASLTGVAINLAFNIAFYKTLGHWGLALGTSLGMGVNFILLTWYYQRILPDALPWRNNASFLLKVCLITLGVSAACFFAYTRIVLYMTAWPLYTLWAVLIPMTLALVVYLLMIRLLGVWTLLEKAMRKKIV